MDRLRRVAGHQFNHQICFTILHLIILTITFIYQRNKSQKKNLYRDLHLKEINKVLKWPRPSISLEAGKNETIIKPTILSDSTSAINDIDKFDRTHVFIR